MIRNNIQKKIAVRAAVAAIPVACALLVSGCQWTPFGTTTNSEGVGKEKLITDAVKMMSSANSMDADIDAKMTAKAEMAGISLGVDAVTDLNVKSAKADNASHADGNITFELIGEKGSLDIETYSLEKDNTRYTYIRQNNSLTGDTGWIVVEDPKDIKSDNGSENDAAFSRLSLADLIGLYGAANDSLAGLTLKDGTESKEGKECYVIEGVLKGEYLSAITDGLGFNVPGLPGMPRPDLSKIDADVRMYFEKDTREPYVIELKIPEVEGVSDENALTFGIDNIDATILFNSFNSNDEIKVPEEVEKSAIVSIDYQELQGLLNAK